MLTESKCVKTDMMETKIIRIEDKNDIKDVQLDEAAQILRNGGLVAFPTETVYGLGANALEAQASAKIYAAKEDRPIIR